MVLVTKRNTSRGRGIEEIVFVTNFEGSKSSKKLPKLSPNRNPSKGIASYASIIDQFAEKSSVKSKRRVRFFLPSPEGPNIGGCRGNQLSERTAGQSTIAKADFRPRAGPAVPLSVSPGPRLRLPPNAYYLSGRLMANDDLELRRAHQAVTGSVSLVEAARRTDDRLLGELLRKAILMGLEKEGQVNAADCSGRTALSYIVSNGPLEILELILQLPGLDINKADNEGNTPLHFAAQAGQIDCLNCLLVRCQDLDVDARNNLGFTPLMKAALQGRNKCAKLLLLAKANPALRDNGRGLRADEWARFCGRYVCADVIEKYAKQRLLERTTSTGNWGRENRPQSRLCMGKVMPLPQSLPQPPVGLKSKLKRVFRQSSTNNQRHQSISEDSYSTAKLVTHLTSAALCASSPALPSVPPVVRSLIRPLTVPKVHITLVNNNNNNNNGLEISDSKPASILKNRTKSVN